MPAKAPQTTSQTKKALRSLGQLIRERRQNLNLSAVATAEAAGMSRITLYRIERGEASVTIGAVLSVIDSLGLTVDLSDPRQQRDSHFKVPSRIKLTDYAQLKKLAWQLKKTKEISPKEALDLYERNWRHLDLRGMKPKERDFLEALLAHFNRRHPLV